jgi:molybdopterin-containing oxidoreductase family iron-sulfur binding subunit
MRETEQQQARYGMVIDLDKCTGCGACMVACAVEHNVPPAHPNATDRTGITPLRVYPVRNNANGSGQQALFLPLPCQQCGSEAPCVSVCPQNAVEVDPTTGIVFQMPQRCLGCRYCMAACPYHARYFNWWDPEWPKGMEKTLTPDVAPRMRGVVEKCNFCHGRLQAARALAIANGQPSGEPVQYEPACVEACPTKAIVFGNLADETSEVAQLINDERSFRLLPQLGTEPKVYYLSKHAWVRKMAQKELNQTSGETIHG